MDNHAWHTAVANREPGGHRTLRRTRKFDFQAQPPRFYDTDPGHRPPHGSSAPVSGRGRDGPLSRGHGRRLSLRVELHAGRLRMSVPSVEGAEQHPKWYAYVCYEVPAEQVRQGAPDSDGTVYAIPNTEQLAAGRADCPQAAGTQPQAGLGTAGPTAQVEPRAGLPSRARSARGTGASARRGVIPLGTPTTCEPDMRGVHRCI